MSERRQRRWSVMDLVTDARTGKMVEAKLWSNIGKLAMSVAFIWVIARGGSSEWLWVSYGGIVVFHDSLTRLQNQRQQHLDKEPTPEAGKPLVK